MYCAKCGTKNDDDSIFCLNCGTDLQRNVDIDVANKKIVKKDIGTSKEIKKIDIKNGRLLVIATFIIMIIVSAIFIYIYNSRANIDNAEEPITVSDKDTIVISDSNRNDTIPNQEIAEVSIYSIPEDASVYINNISRGNTPAKINLPEGNYSLKMNITGYKSIESDFNVTIKPGYDTEIIINTTFEPILNEST